MPRTKSEIPSKGNDIENKGDKITGTVHPLWASPELSVDIFFPNEVVKMQTQ